MMGSAKAIASDGNDLLIFVEEVADNTPWVIVETSLRQYDINGNIVGACRLPLEVCDSYPSNPLDVSENGKIYYLAPGEQNINIYEVHLGDTYTSQLETMVATATAEAALVAQNANDVGLTAINAPLPRNTVRSRCINNVSVTWTWNPSQHDYYPNNGGQRASNRRPAQLSTSSSYSVTGIPYLYGGWDSSYSVTHNAPWGRFLESVTYYKNRNTTGPVMGDILDTTYAFGGSSSGIDCSGFVSAMSGTYTGEKPSAQTVGANAKTVSGAIGSSGGTNLTTYSAMQPMDIFYNQKHVLFYERRNLSSGGIYTYESTRDHGTLYGGDSQGTKIIPRSWSNLQQFQLRTFYNLSTGDDFSKPYTAVRSGTCMTGQSVYFKLTVPSTTGTTLSLTSTNGNADLYVYNNGYTSLIGSSTNKSGVDRVQLSSTYRGSTIYVQVYVPETTANYTLKWE